MIPAKERACGESLSNRLGERYARKASFARTISDSDYESARIGAAAKRCADRGEHYAKHATRTSLSALKRVKSSKHSAMQWARSGFGSIRDLIYLDWIDEEEEELTEGSQKIISGWAPKEQKGFTGAKVSDSPWLTTNHSPTRVRRTPKGRYVPAKVAQKQRSQRPSRPSYPSLPDVANTIRRPKARPLDRLIAKQEIVSEQHSPLNSALRSLSPSSQKSYSTKRLIGKKPMDQKLRSKTPFERILSDQIQELKGDKQLAPIDIASSRLRQGKQKTPRGLRPTWTNSPMMKELLALHEPTAGEEIQALTSNRTNLISSNRTEPISSNRTEPISSIRTEPISSNRTEPISSNRIRPSKRVATRTGGYKADQASRSILPAPTVQVITELLNHSNSKEVLASFGGSALKIASSRRLLDGLSRSSSSLMAPVSSLSASSKRLLSRNERQSVQNRNRVLKNAPVEALSNILAPWPMIRSGQEAQTERQESSGLSVISKRGLSTGLEDFASGLQSAIKPYQSNVELFQPNILDKRRGEVKEQWLSTPDMITTMSDVEEEAYSEEQASPRRSAWAPKATSSPWMSTKAVESQLQAASSRLATREDSRANNSLFPKLQSASLTTRRLIQQLPKANQRKWTAVLEKVGKLNVVQQQQLSEHVAAAQIEISENVSAVQLKKSFPLEQRKPGDSRKTTKALINPIQHAAIRDTASRKENPTRPVMTSVLARTALTTVEEVAQALDAVQNNGLARKGFQANSSSFWVDVFRGKNRTHSKARTSGLSYSQPDSITLVSDTVVPSTNMNSEYNSSLSNTIGMAPRVSDRLSSFERPTQSLEPIQERASSHFDRVFERSDALNWSDPLSKLKPTPDGLPAWSNNISMPSPEYLQQSDSENEIFEQDSKNSQMGPGARVVSGWGASKHLAYVHSSGKIVPASQAKAAGLPSPATNRVRLPLGWTLEAVDAKVVNQSLPNWAKRASEKPLIRGASDLINALVRADSQDEVVRVIFDRANQSLPSMQTLPSAATQVIEQIRKEAHKNQLETSARRQDEVAMSRISAEGKPRRRSAKVVSGFNGLRALSSATKTVHDQEDKVSKLAKRLQDLVLLAEEKSRKEAQMGVRMAENSDEAIAEGHSVSKDEASNAEDSRDIDALFQEVLSLYEREKDFRLNCRPDEPNNNDPWW